MPSSETHTSSRLPELEDVAYEAGSADTTIHREDRSRSAAKASAVSLRVLLFISVLRLYYFVELSIP